MQKSMSLADFMKTEAAQLNEYRERDINIAQTLANETSKFYPCEVRIAINKEDGRIYFDYPFVKLSHPELNLTIGTSHKRKYFISCRSFDELNNMDYHTRNAACKDVPEPNNIGVLNEKKILDWVNYYEECMRRCKDVDKVNEDKKTAFLKSIEGLNVRWQTDKKRGYIEKNGIQFSFEIADSHISTKTTLVAYDSSLAAFLKLSDNKFTARH